MSIYLFINMNNYLSIYLSLYLTDYLSILLFIYLTINHLCMYLRSKNLLSMYLLSMYLLSMYLLSMFLLSLYLLSMYLLSMYLQSMYLLSMYLLSISQCILIWRCACEVWWKVPSARGSILRPGAQVPLWNRTGGERWYLRSRHRDC